MSKIEQNLAANDLQLPELSANKVLFAPFVLDGHQLYISGQLPLGFANIEEYKGQLGGSVSIEKGKEIAKYCVLNVLAQAKQALSGDLDKIKKCLKITVFVNSTSTFVDHPQVANGASEVLNMALGIDASHARSAIGVSQLPLGVAVEVEAIFAI